MSCDEGEKCGLSSINKELREIKDLLTNMVKNLPARHNNVRPTGEHPLKQRAVSVCTEIDWLFKKSGNGGYDYKVANESAYRFLIRLKKQGNAQANLEAFLNWLHTEARAMNGSLRVTPSMFDFLETLYREHRPRLQA